MDELLAKIRNACEEETAAETRAAVREGIDELVDLAEEVLLRRHEYKIKHSTVLSEVDDVWSSGMVSWYRSAPVEQGGYGESMANAFRSYYAVMHNGRSYLHPWARDVWHALRCYDRNNVGGNVCTNPNAPYPMRGDLREKLAALGVDNRADLHSLCRLREAAIGGDVDTVEALVARGVDVDVGLPSIAPPLLEAARAKAFETAGILVENGASVDSVDIAGWTPLHYTLAGPMQEESAQRQRRALAFLLLERGAPAGAATTVVGWTPLHLAAAAGDRAVVGALLGKGADPNAATVVGGWTPLFLAEREGHHAVAGVMRAAGGISRAAGASQPFPLHLYGRGRPQSWTFDMEPRHAVPDFDTAGYISHVDGNFTGLGRPERLVFERVGFEPESGRMLTAAALRRADGESQVLWAADSYRKFLRLCRDPESRLDHALFAQGFGGNCCGTEMEVWHTDPASKEFGLAYSFECSCDEPDALSDSIAWPDRRGHCQWKRRLAAEEALARTLPELRVGETIPVAYKGAIEIRLPSRAIPSETAEAGLATLRTLPDEIATTEKLNSLAPSDGDGASASGRWEVVSVARSGRGADGYHGTDGALLVRDNRSGDWRSIYDCGNIVLEGMRGDMLLVSVPADYDVGGSDDSPCSPGLTRAVQIDLGTLRGRNRD